MSEYVDHWLQVKEAKLKPRTQRIYAELLRHHIKPVIGDVRLAKLRRLHLEGVQREARKKGLSDQTLLHIHRVVFTTLRQAVKWQLAARNVAEAVDAPKARRKKIDALEPAAHLKRRLWYGR